MREIVILLFLGAINIVSAKYMDPLFPPDLFTTSELRDKGYILLYLIGMDFMLIAAAFANDHFVVAAFEVVIRKIKNPNIRDIIQSILIPLTRSFPKFTIGWMGMFLALSDIGISTLVGSITFHSTITMACFFFTNSPIINIYWPHFIRDLIFYILSVIMFIVVMLDYTITKSESAMFPILFVVFAVAVFITGIKFKKHGETEGKIEIPLAKLDEVDLDDNGVQNKNKAPIKTIFPRPPNTSCGCGCVVSWMLYIRMLVPSAIVWLSMFCLDPKRRKDSSVWPVFIIPSILFGSVWVIVGIYLGIWWATVVGETRGFPPEIMGFVVLAVYVSVPTTAHVVSRKSLDNLFGEMVTTVCIGQMLPTFIYTLLFKHMPITSEYLPELLIASIIFPLLSIIFLRFCTDRCTKIYVGVIYVLVYIFILIPLYAAGTYGYIQGFN